MPVRFIILSAARTGSTLLHTYLNSHPNVISFGEYLGRERRKGRPLTIEKRLGTSSTSVSALGLKVFYDYYRDQEYSDALSYLEAANDVRVIHLTRDNLLEMYISRELALKSGAWTQSKRSDRVQPVVVPPADCLRFFEETERNQKEILLKFGKHPVLPVSYEALTGKKAATLQEVQNFLSLPVKTLSTLLQPQSNTSVNNMVENYDQLAETIATTRWKHLLHR